MATAKEQFESLLPQLQSVFETHAKEALTQLAAAGADALAAGKDVVAQMEKAASLYAKGQIAEEDAAMAAEAGMLSLDNIKRGLVNEEAQAAAARGRALLLDLQQMLFGAAKMAFTLGVAALAAYLSGGALGSVGAAVGAAIVNGK